MPIVVGHEPPIATAGNLALATGQGEAVERARVRAAAARQAAAEAAQRAAEFAAEQQARQQALAWDQKKFYDAEQFKQGADEFDWRKTLAEKGIDFELQKQIDL
jgi:hypothetical protein